MIKLIDKLENYYNNNKWFRIFYKIFLFIINLIIIMFAIIGALNLKAASSPKVFEVNDVLPATTQLKISWHLSHPEGWSYFDGNVKTTNQYLYIYYGVEDSYSANGAIKVNNIIIDEIEDISGNITIDTSSWTETQRTVTQGDIKFTWADLSTPLPGYSITYEENGGSTLTDLTDQTALPSPQTAPSKPGYTFLGWYYESNFITLAQPGDILTSNVTLYAKWSQITYYTITYEENGGSIVTDSPQAISLPTPLPTTTKSGYTFNGWYYDSDFTSQAYAYDTLIANVILYAKWTLNTYTITFEENGGSPVTDLTDQTALPTPLPTTTKSGYTLKGWYYDSDFTSQVQSSDTLTANVILYAKWENYSITFEENGGSPVTDLTDQTALPTPLPSPYKEYHTFLGWYYNSDFTTQVQSSDTLTANVILYAKWEQKPLEDIYQDGYDEGYKDGEYIGYYEGISDNPDKHWTNLLFTIFSAFGTFLSIEILPGWTIGVIIGIPIVFGLIYFIIGRKKD